MLKEANHNFENLSGKFLIASPYFFFSEVYNKSIIYVASHNEEGAVGLMINRLVNRLPFNSVLKLLNDEGNVGDLILPVYVGGPVEPERGFILHTAEYQENLLLKFPDNLAVSSNIKILKDIAHGTGPRDSMFVLGYTGWGAGQLEQEMEKNMWLVSECDKELLFSKSDETKWDAALANLGIDDSLFVPTAGNC